METASWTLEAVLVNITYIIRTKPYGLQKPACGKFARPFSGARPMNARVPIAVS
jgi:hypothetical protein